MLQGAQEPLVSLAPTKTLTIGCVNVPAGTPWASLCAAWVPIRTSIFNPVSLAHRLSDAFDAITNGQQTLKNEMSNMTSQVCVCVCVCMCLCAILFFILAIVKYIMSVRADLAAARREYLSSMHLLLMFATHLPKWPANDGRH